MRPLSGPDDAYTLVVHINTVRLLPPATLWYALVYFVLFVKYTTRLKQSNAKHIFQNAFFLCLSLCLAPATTAIVLAVSTDNYMFGLKGRVEHSQSKKRILVTGVSMSKAVELARLFHQQGHIVIVADVNALACGGISRALRKFHCRCQPQACMPRRRSPRNTWKSFCALSKQKMLTCGVRIRSWLCSTRLYRQTCNRTAHQSKAIQFDSQHVNILDAKDTFIEHVQKNARKKIGEG